MKVNSTALLKWADETAAAYVVLAKQYDLGFYTQSDLTKISQSPKVVIIGINGGSDGSYTDQINNPGWMLDGEDLLGTDLIKGNYFKDEKGVSEWDKRETWTYFKRLKDYFRNVIPYNPLNDESKFVLTNMSFFNTAKAKQHSNELFDKTLIFTIQLIDVLKPARIVFLSGKEAFSRLDRYKKTNSNFQFSYDKKEGSLLKGEINGIPCIGVPHPSAHLTTEQRDNVRRFITEFMNGPLTDDKN
jgi:hypothetical protein